jgi:hypothetical protein
MVDVTDAVRTAVSTVSWRLDMPAGTKVRRLLCDMLLFHS